MTDCVYFFFIVFGFRQTQPHAFNKLLLSIMMYAIAYVFYVTVLIIIVIRLLRAILEMLFVN